MKSSIFGKTASGLPIPAFHFGRSGAEVLILGGVHGDEPEGVIACWGLVDRWSANFPLALLITIVPAFNMDGVLSNNRLNARGVDLNRNLPTNDWTKEVASPRYHPGPEPASEPENRSLLAWLAAHPAEFVISMHSWKPMLNVNGNCTKEAAVISAWTGYRVEESVGYPTPGCLGTYLGLERAVPTLTYEIERGLDTKSILEVHVPALIEGLKHTETKRKTSL
jgi:protein MpaA